MIKKIYILLLVLVGVIVSSCSDYLESDQYFKDRMTIEKVFESKPYAEEWLAHVYAELLGQNMDVASKDVTPQNFADDMYWGDRDSDYDPTKIELSYNKFKTGDYNESEKQDSWTRSYRGIRNASTFIHNIYMNKEMNDDEITDYRGQARFARAYLYWLLLRKYGPIPLLPDEGIDYTESYDAVATPRSSYEECAEFISNELLQAAKEMEKLGMKRGQDVIGRPTCGAALAARAKVLLYAASPIANGNNETWAAQVVDDQGRRLLSTEYNEEKWAKAAAAARDVIELAPTAGYDLYVNYSSTKTTAVKADGNFSEKEWPYGWANIDPCESYRQLFNGSISASGNAEMIFTRGTNEGAGVVAMVAHQLPRSATGWNTHGLTQKLVDAYYMNDGTDTPGKDFELAGRGDGSARPTGFITQGEIDGNPDKYKPLRAGVSFQYAEREPRFYASVAYSGTFWTLYNESKEENRNKQLFYYRDDDKGNGYTSSNAYWLRTGIGMRKYVHDNDTYEGGSSSKIMTKVEPAMRYADILLMYAEALNELTGTYTIPSWKGESYTISRTRSEMERGIHPVRIRAGVPDYPDSEYAASGRDQMRERIKRERFIELMAEGQRYYDLRRWLDANDEEALPIYGCNVLMDQSKRDLFHTPVAVWSLRTSFADKMWFWPISHDELKKNSRLTQNPGWTYND
ncbi:MAG: RagB/SusD family nutrient uptake outer membrane protein [Prevotella sp.]|nr:RagB/SusD family nutrient uptake outer membrane protein [Prevotella sp.]